MNLSRGARRLFELIQRFANRYDQVIPSQAWLAADLKRAGHRASLRSVNRWIAELSGPGGMLHVTHRGPKSASYKLRQKEMENGVAFGVAFGVAKRSGPYVNSSRLNGEERKPPQMEQNPSEADRLYREGRFSPWRGLTAEQIEEARTMAASA